MHNLVKVGIALSLSLALAACSSTPNGEGQNGANGMDGAGGAVTTGAAHGAGWNANAMGAERQGLLNTLTIYFDFDSSDIRSDFQGVVAAHGEYLATHPEEKVTVEGHADERGSREYNIALGERRANAVKRYMMSHGAAERQFQVISYGEERPAAEGGGEQVWSMNRRAQLVY